MLTPALAEAQARGTLQVTARVVDNRASWEALDAVQAAAANMVALNQPRGTVTTLATVTVGLPTVSGESRVQQAPGALLVTVDYSRN